MKTIQSLLTLSSLFALGCGVNIAIELEREGDPAAITAVNTLTDTSYSISLTRGEILLTTLVGVDVEELSELNSGVLFDFIGQDSTNFLGIGTIPSRESEPLFVAFTPVNGGEPDGELNGVALLVEGSITLSDDSVVAFIAKVPAPAEGEIESLQIEKNLIGGDEASATFSINNLFNQIDFDSLGAGAVEIIIEANTGDTAIDDAVLILQDNLSSSFDGTPLSL